MELKHEVVGQGPIGQVLIIGESPSPEDLKAGIPFSGPSGQILRKYCSQVGLASVRFENVCERSLPGNDFRSLYRDQRKSLPSAELQAWHKDLIERIRLIKPRVIICAGAEALKALTDYSNLSDVHCYVLDSILVNCPIIPVFHPSLIFSQPSNAFWLKYGLAKAKQVLDGAKDAKFELKTANTEEEVISWLQKAPSGGEICIDIETLKNESKLTAIGASVNSECAISVTPDSPAWDRFLKFCLSAIENPEFLKIGQNFMFDAMILWKLYGTVPQGQVWDTMHAGNVLYSDLKKSLKELARLYLFHPPWKGGWNSTGERLRIYNAQDVVITHRVFRKQWDDLVSHSLIDYWRNSPMRMWLPSFKLATRGIRVDTKARDGMLLELELALKPVRESVKAFADPLVSPAQKKAKKRDPLNDILVKEGIDHVPEKEKKLYYVAKKKDQKFGKEIGACYRKAFRDEITLVKRHFNPRSPGQTESVLINAGVKLPKVKSQTSHSWEESTNEKALKKILERGSDPGPVIGFVRSMLVIRHGEKLISSYCRADLDPDGRWRCSYNVEGTETGRSSTKQTPWETGGNNQNIPRGSFLGVKFKKVFIPDEGKVFFQADQSQAEARVVAALSGCHTMLKLFRDGNDIHEFAASSLLGDDMRQLRDRDPDKYKTFRQYAKIVNHGGNYDMGPATLAENALKDGIELTVKQAEAFLKKRREIFPEIYLWHEKLKEELHKTRTLWTPFGRRRVWLGKIGPEMYREAFAHIPQSVVPHITNLMWQMVNLHGMYEVLQMGHDSLLMQIHPKDVSILVPSFLAATKEILFSCGVVDAFNIPWDCSTGPSWAEMKSWVA